MIWTYTHLLAFALGGLVFVGGSLLIAKYLDWRVSAAEEQRSGPERGLEEGDLIPIGEDGELQEVRAVYPDRAGGITTIETESR